MKKKRIDENWLEVEGLEKEVSPFIEGLRQVGLRISLEAMGRESGEDTLRYRVDFSGSHLKDLLPPVGTVY